MGRMDRDQAGIGPHAAVATNLVRLRELKDVRVVEGDADVRGWDVCTINGAKVGVVEDLLIDRAHGEVVMLDVDLVGSNRHTLAPIRAAQIDRVRRIVLMDSADLNGPDDVALSSRPAVAEAPRSADGVEEVVVERRPVVYEEVVRRRVVDPDRTDPPTS
jgi:sporulation protein YlmC with PRC-barrel domain